SSAAVPFDGPLSRGPRSTRLGVIPAGDLAVDGVDDAFPLPANNGYSVLCQLFGNVSVCGAAGVHTDNVLPVLDRVLDLPVHPIALSGVVCNENDQGARPADARPEVLLLDVVRVVGIIRLVAVDRAVAHFHAGLRDEVLQ